MFLCHPNEENTTTDKPVSVLTTVNTPATDHDKRVKTSALSNIRPKKSKRRKNK